MIYLLLLIYYLWHAHRSPQEHPPVLSRCLQIVILPCQHAPQQFTCLFSPVVFHLWLFLWLWKSGWHSDVFTRLLSHGTSWCLPPSCLLQHFKSLSRWLLDVTYPTGVTPQYKPIHTRNIVCHFHTFENNLGMKQSFTKYLKEIYCLSSDWHFSFKCFTKNTFVRQIFPK